MDSAAAPFGADVSPARNARSATSSCLASSATAARAASGCVGAAVVGAGADGSLADSEERIKSRLRLYREQEADVLNFYKEQGLLKTINGEQSIEAIFKDIEAVVSKA